MKKAVIISGGNIEEDFALRFLQEKKYDFIIAADRGLQFLREHGLQPTHIVGDFDSGEESWLKEYENNPFVSIRKFQPEKDWTDTEIAAKLAVDLGCETIDILGATGTRMDHVMGNIQLLALMLEQGADCHLIDARNKIYMRNRDFTVKRQQQWGNYFSLFAYGGDVTGLTLEGMKYPLNHFTLGTVGTRGVSNEIVEDTAHIRFAAGRLLVMETRD